MSKSQQKNEWVSLSEAADLLGVHPATVRNWSDRGDLPTRRTPGGHRRFRRADLEQWSTTQHQPPPAEIQMLIQSAMGRMRMHISGGDLTDRVWYLHMSDDRRQGMRVKGKEMLEGLQQYLVDVTTTGESDLDIQTLGRGYGEMLVKEGLSLRDAMQGFLVFSNLLQDAALNIVEIASARPVNEWLQLLRQVRHFEHELLIGMIESYDAEA